MVARDRLAELQALQQQHQQGECSPHQQPPHSSPLPAPAPHPSASAETADQEIKQTTAAQPVRLAGRPVKRLLRSMRRRSSQSGPEQTNVNNLNSAEDTSASSTTSIEAGNELQQILTLVDEFNTAHAELVRLGPAPTAVAVWTPARGEQLRGQVERRARLYARCMELERQLRSQPTTSPVAAHAAQAHRRAVVAKLKALPAPTLAPVDVARGGGEGAGHNGSGQEHRPATAVHRQVQELMGLDKTQAAMQRAEREELLASVQSLERSLLEVHDMFQQIQLLVQEQGEHITAVQAQVREAAHDVEGGRRHLAEGRRLRRRLRRRRILAGLGGGAVVVLIILLVVVVAA